VNSSIEFDRVRFSRAGAAVLDDFSLAVEAGEVVALVGRSGVGKTTALKLINRLLLPDAGTVRVSGRNTRTWDPIRLRRHTGYVLQEIGLFPHMTVADNVGVMARLEAWPESRVRARVHELLDLVGLPAETFASRWPQDLSGGQRQRVGVARALTLDPPILLMDEPFGSLDPITRAELHREVTRIQNVVRKTIVLVTHDMAEAFALADRIGVLDGGRLVVCDRPSRVRQIEDPRVRLLMESVEVRIK
jgi:osmoprotectant transport system ATP-binding protein